MCVDMYKHGRPNNHLHIQRQNRQCLIQLNADWEFLLVMYLYVQHYSDVIILFFLNKYSIPTAVSHGVQKASSTMKLVPVSTVWNTNNLSFLFFLMEAEL